MIAIKTAGGRTRQSAVRRMSYLLLFFASIVFLITFVNEVARDETNAMVILAVKVPSIEAFSSRREISLEVDRQALHTGVNLQNHSHESHSPKSESDSMDWYQRHRDRKLVIEDELRKWKRENAARLLTHDDGENDKELVPELDYLREEFRERLAAQGLTMVGDSTARLLFGSIWCLLEGIFDQDKTETIVGWNRKIPIPPQKVDHLLLTACKKRQAQLKNQCSSTSISAQQECETSAIFSNKSDDNEKGDDSLPYPGTLEYVGYHRFGPFSHGTSINVTSPNKVIVILMPCLHNLWSPGAGEVVAKSNQDEWPDLLDNFYSVLNSTFYSGQWFVATPVTLAEDKLKFRLDLVNHYLKGKEFDATDPASMEIQEFYIREGKHAYLLPSRNYSGPIPLYNESAHGSHRSDDSLFDGVGEQFCEWKALQHAPPATSAASPIFLDIAKATSVRSSNDTLDGIHYDRGLTLRRQLWLILKAMRWSAQHNQKRKVAVLA